MATKIEVKDYKVLGSMISKSGKLDVRKFSKNGTEIVAMDLSAVIKADDTLTAKYLIAMTYTLANANVEENTPFKFPVVDVLLSRFAEFIKVTRWTVKPGKGHENETIYCQFLGDYYKSHWIKNPTEAQMVAVSEFEEKYLSDEYILAGLTSESPRNKENVIKAMCNQVPRIFHVSQPETITRLKSLVKFFLKYYINEKDGKLSYKNVSVFSEMQTAVNPIHLIDENLYPYYDEVLKQVKATTATVTFGIHNGINIPGTLKVGEKEFKVVIKPILGCYENYEGREIKVVILKKFNRELMAVPVMFSAEYGGKQVVYAKEEMEKYIKENKGEPNMNLHNKFGFFAAHACEMMHESLNALAREYEARVEGMNKIESTKDIFKVLSDC